MRHIGTLPDEEQARRLADYLLTLEVAAEVRPARDGWGLWVVHEDRVSRGRDELEAYLRAPDDPRYREAAREARERRRDAERAEREHARKTVEMRDRLDVVTPRRCPVVHGLIVISVAVALLTGFGRNYSDLVPFYVSPPVINVEFRPADPETGRPGSALPVQGSAGLRPILRGEVWRLFTPMFIHYGVPHLVFNMLALYWFGSLIEMRKGSWTLLALILAACPVSFVAQYAWDFQQYGLDRVSLPGGMSGVVYALFGYCWMRGEYDPEGGLGVGQSTVIWMLMWLALCFTGGLGPIANAAHLGGLVFGMGAGLGPYLFRRRSEA
jgi:GlpG protein